MEASFTGEAESTLTLLGVAPYARIDLIGVGADNIDRAAAENFGGTASALLGDTDGGSVQILWSDKNADTHATAARVAFGYRQCHLPAVFCGARQRAVPGAGQRLGQGSG